MAYTALTGGAYQARSLIASAQRCINLVPEAMPQAEGEPSPVAHYPTPGLRLAVTAGTGGVRGEYRASSGTLYVVIGTGVYTMNATPALTLVGTMASSSGPVSMADNSVTLLIVDGTITGYTVDLASQAFGTVVSAAFYGADRVDILDGFFCLNRPGTNQFYLSDNIATTFNPLYIAAKAGLDKLVSLVVVRRELWLLGERSVQIYQNSGAPDFPFQIITGGIEHGCAAKHSVVKMDGAMLWLASDPQGKAIVLRGANYQAQRVSTHAIEAMFQSFGTISDAVGWSYQQSGHTIYVLTFPTAGQTWCLDLATGLWHQWVSNGGMHPCASQAATFGANYVGDRTLPNIYVLDPNIDTDNGVPITRLRSFPHIIHGNAQRVVYSALIADMQTGTVAAGLPEPQLQLRYSDDRGLTWGTPQYQGMGTSGQGIVSLQFQRLGMARDRVFELSWSGAGKTALQGAWIQTRVAAT